MATATNVIQWVGFFFLVVYNFVMLGNYLSILSPHGLCQTSFILITGAFMAALASALPSFEELSYLAGLALLITVFSLYSLCQESWVAHTDDDDGTVTYSEVTFSSIVDGCTAMAFAFGGSGEWVASSSRTAPLLPPAAPRALPRALPRAEVLRLLPCTNRRMTVPLIYRRPLS